VAVATVATAPAALVQQLQQDGWVVYPSIFLFTKHGVQYELLLEHLG
jgi:protein-L-isoaspartate O-methyltransferase